MNLLKLFARSLKFTLAPGWQLGNEATRKEKEEVLFTKKKIHFTIYYYYH